MVQFKHFFIKKKLSYFYHNNKSPESLENYVQEWDCGNNPFIIKTGLPGQIFFDGLTLNKTEEYIIVIDDQYMALCRSKEFTQFFIFSRQHNVSFIIISQNLYGGLQSKTIR